MTRPLFIVCLSSLLLSACSPHPGSGIWVPLDDSEAPYTRLEVLFEGRAELFAPGREGHLYRCFWGGTDADSIRLDCISADDEAVKPVFTFRVAADGTGELIASGESIGFFQRTEEKPTRE